MTFQLVDGGVSLLVTCNFGGRTDDAENMLLQTSAVRMSGTGRIVPRLGIAFLGSSTRMGLYLNSADVKARRDGLIELIAFPRTMVPDLLADRPDHPTHIRSFVRRSESKIQK